MENLTTGGSAFPQSDKVASALSIANSQGMTLRDYFAAKAMIGVMATERAEQFVDEDGYEMGDEEGDSGTLFVHTKFLAEEAYLIADLMLNARNK